MRIGFERQRLMGFFITFEGGEGSGKSTQARILAQRLRAAGRDVVMTREPGGTPLAERVRKRLLAEAPNLSPVEQAILFAAARADHVEQVIAPAVARGEWVVCDRFADSTHVYQGAAGANMPLVEALRTVAVGDCEPHLTLVMDCPVDVGRGRVAARAGQDDPFDRDADAVQQARRDGFIALAKREPERCLLVDASQSRDAQSKVIWNGVQDRLVRPPLAHAD
ncbi:MAG: dTMP kinase [Pseudomonadota bacterium]